MNTRVSNIELLRIISMLMIVLVHANFVSLYSPNKEDILLAPFSSFWRILAEQICIVGVNVFVLISGWFGIKPSIKGLCSLLYQVIFWGAVILLFAIIFNLDIPVKPTIQVFWFGSYYWFVIAYIGLYLISPVLNVFVEKATPRQFLIVLVCFFSVEFIYGWMIDSDLFNQGYSIISFIGLYLLARYLRLYSAKLKRMMPSANLFFYGLLTIIPTIISYVGIKYGWKTFHPIFYSSPFVIGAAVFLFLFFSKLQLKNTIINWIACSTFCVYLIHFHPIIFPYFIKFTQSLSESYNTFSYSCIILSLAIVFLLLCVLFDKLRIGSWRFICIHFFDSTFSKLEKSFNRMIDRMAY